MKPGKRTHGLPNYASIHDSVNHRKPQQRELMRKRPGAFKGLFDRNKDGKLSPLERSLDYAMFQALSDEVKRDELRESLTSAGLDELELRCMSEEHRDDILMGKGLRPSEYKLLDW